MKRKKQTRKNRKKKVVVDFEKLNEKQKKFIRGNVERFGSADKAKSFYNLNDTVSAYAWELAGEIYK
ncbi:MAG: hypothetical protein FVQ80_07180 [Planctomycetes bacterium]|nr:hypothetical protein [Planctomycetota bacterium]